jgi:ADP-heptose:LPS heptosyltransferase
MFTPALRLMRAAWPETRLVALTMRPGERDLLAHNRDLDDVRFSPLLEHSLGANLRFFLELRREGFEMSVLPCPHNRLEYNVAAYLSGCRQRVGFRYLQQSLANMHFLNNLTYAHADNVHNTEHNLRLVESLTGATRHEVPGWSPELQLPTTGADRDAVVAFLDERGLAGARCVGLHVSSSRAKHMERKCWPKEHFLALIEELGRHDEELRFLLFCGDEDLPETEWILARCDSRVQVAMRLPIRVVAELLRLCSLCVTNDSGILHVACAVQTPSVAIFGPTNPRRTGPWAATATVVRRELPCSPCFYHTSRDLVCRAGLDFVCLRELSVERVVEAAERLLETTPRAEARAKPVFSS